MALPRFRGTSRFSTWLYRITLNAAHDQRLKRRPEPSEVAVEKADPRDLFIESELSGELQQALDALDEDFRLSVVLYDVLGCPYDEIAQLTDVPEGTVKSRIYRGRKELARLLGTPAAQTESKTPMTTDIHPEDLELFEYVEGELRESRRADVELHIEQCSRCAEEVHALEAGKAALRTAPMLELPARRTGLILGDLPRQDDDGRARVPFFTPKRLIAVLTPVAAVLVVVTVLVNTDGGGDIGDSAAPAPAEAAPAEPTAPAEPAAPESAAIGGDAASEDELRSEATQAAPAEAAEAPAEGLVEEAAAEAAVALIAGPPATAARFLQDAGFDAKVIDGAVEVTGATSSAVLRALEEYPTGTVPVVIP